jgi:uncharacterized membrane protein
MTALALAAYCACVDFMLHASRLFGFTYRDANALLFFVVWPAVTIALVAVVLSQRATLKKLERARE